MITATLASEEYSSEYHFTCEAHKRDFLSQTFLAVDPDGVAPEPCDG